MFRQCKMLICLSTLGLTMALTAGPAAAHPAVDFGQVGGPSAHFDTQVGVSMEQCGASDCGNTDPQVDPGWYMEECSVCVFPDEEGEVFVAGKP